MSDHGASPPSKELPGNLMCDRCRRGRDPRIELCPCGAPSPGDDELTILHRQRAAVTQELELLKSGRVTRSALDLQESFRRATANRLGDQQNAAEAATIG